MRLQRTSIVLLLLAGVAITACRCRLQKDDVLAMGQRIEADLPLGSNQTQVAKFLDDMRIDRGGRTVIMDTTRYKDLQQIMGTISSGEPEGTLVFFFRDDKLVEWWVRSDCGGGCYSMRASKSMYRPVGVNQCYDP